MGPGLADGRHALLALTDAGYKVRGAVRDEKKAEFLRSISEDLEVAIIGDMTKVRDRLSELTLAWSMG